MCRCRGRRQQGQGSSTKQQSCSELCLCLENFETCPNTFLETSMSSAGMLRDLDAWMFCSSVVYMRPVALMLA